MFLKSILCKRSMFGYCYHSVNGTVMVCPKVIPLSDIHCTKFLFVQTLKPSYNCLAKYVCNFYSSHTPNNIKVWKQKHTKCKKEEEKNDDKLFLFCCCKADKNKLLFLFEFIFLLWIKIKYLFSNLHSCFFKA